MSERLERLLEAHVQHELSRWRGETLTATLESQVRALFHWFEEVKLDDVLTRAQIMGVIERYVIDLRVSGGITELSGEMSRLIFTSEASADTRLDQVLTPEMYREFADKLLALEGVRHELLELIAESSTAREVSAQLIARAVLDLVAVAVPLRAALLPPALLSLSAKASALVIRPLEQLAARALDHYRERIAHGEGEHREEPLASDRLRSVVDELWDRVSSLRLSDVFGFIQEQDIEDFVVLGFEFWLRYRKTDFFRRVSAEVIDHVFLKYGQSTVLAVIDDMGVSEGMVAAEVLALLRPMVEQAASGGALERNIRRKLEAFYRSDAALAACGD